LLSAVLRGFTGYLLIRYPIMGEMSLTMLLASLFIVGGTFRAIGAAWMRFPQWGWTTLSGMISVVLGVMLLAQLPTPSLWFIGLAVGVDFVFAPVLIHINGVTQELADSDYFAHMVDISELLR
jgi:uncharacterized membrane protein HdeD (DUF308 family)